MRTFIALMAVASLTACSPTSEARLPAVGTVFADLETGTRFRVTWAGTTTYNQGACPEVNTLCVHLVNNIDEPLAAELAMTLDELNAKFREISR